MSNWISVDDRLPGFNKSVLLYCVGDKTQDPPPHFIELGWLKLIDNRGPIFRTEDHMELSKAVVLGWMPLPAPPEGEDE